MTLTAAADPPPQVEAPARTTAATIRRSSLPHAKIRAPGKCSEPALIRQLNWLAEDPRVSSIMFGTSHIKGATGVEPGTVKFRRLEDLQICLRGYTRNEIMDVIIYAKDRHNLEELADHYRKVLPA